MSMAIKAAKFQGDPGLFGFIGRQARRLGGAALGVIPGGGAVRTALGIGAGFLGGRVTPSAPRQFAVPGRFAGTQQAFARPGTGFRAPTAVTRVPGFAGALQRLLPGGKTGFETVAAPGVAPGIAPTGFHLNRTSYFLQDGTFVEKGSRFVRNRRRNPGNMRAADRAISRIESAKRMARRLSRITVRDRCPKPRRGSRRGNPRD